MNKNDIWMKYEKNKVIKSNFYLRIYDSINKSNGKNVIIKEYNKRYIDKKMFESIEKFYKLINSITILETKVEKDYNYIVLEKGVFDLENYLNQRNQGLKETEEEVEKKRNLLKQSDPTEDIYSLLDFLKTPLEKFKQISKNMRKAFMDKNAKGSKFSYNLDTGQITFQGNGSDLDNIEKSEIYGQVAEVETKIISCAKNIMIKTIMHVNHLIKQVKNISKELNEINTVKNIDQDLGSKDDVKKCLDKFLEFQKNLNVISRYLKEVPEKNSKEANKNAFKFLELKKENNDFTYKIKKNDHNLEFITFLDREILPNWEEIRNNLSEGEEKTEFSQKLVSFKKSEKQVSKVLSENSSKIGRYLDETNHIGIILNDKQLKDLEYAFDWIFEVTQGFKKTKHKDIVCYFLNIAGDITTQIEKYRKHEAIIKKVCSEINTVMFVKDSVILPRMQEEDRNLLKEQSVLETLDEKIFQKSEEVLNKIKYILDIS